MFSQNDGEVGRSSPSTCFISFHFQFLSLSFSVHFISFLYFLFWIFYISVTLLLSIAFTLLRSISSF